MANLRLHILVLVCCASLLILECHGHPQPSKKYVALFIFGDSIYDPGNNNYINRTGASANYWPYGMTFFKHPTGRFSDGRLISDFIGKSIWYIFLLKTRNCCKTENIQFLAAAFASLPPIRPYLEPGFTDYYYGVNFASSGVGALPESNPFVSNEKRFKF